MTQLNTSIAATLINHIKELDGRIGAGLDASGRLRAALDAFRLEDLIGTSAPVVVADAPMGEMYGPWQLFGPLHPRTEKARLFRRDVRRIRSGAHLRAFLEKHNMSVDHFASIYRTSYGRPGTGSNLRVMLRSDRFQYDTQQRFITAIETMCAFWYDSDTM